MNMKKIGIITYHFAVNYGAVLQCYALNKALGNVGTNSKIINYISDVQYNNNALYRKNGVKNLLKNILLLPFHKVRAQRQNRFNDFRVTYLNVDSRIKSIDKLEHYIYEENFDILISGSDQVWNPNIEDFNEAFLFPFHTQAKKIGYAISIGQATVVDLASYEKWIKKFDVITVRERSSCELAAKISGKTVENIVDPVFLLTEEQWDSIIPPIERHDKFIMCYFVKTTELDKKVEIAKTIAKEKNLHLLIISPRITKNNFVYEVVSDAGPLEFLAYIKKAEYICTDSFHGTVFSVILKKQFLTLERIQEKNDSRKSDILQQLGLENRIQYLNETVKDKPVINYRLVEPAMRQVREQAIKMLVEMIDK